MDNVSPLCSIERKRLGPSGSPAAGLITNSLGHLVHAITDVSTLRRGAGAMLLAMLLVFPTLAAELLVPNAYPGITAALAAAAPGDTIVLTKNRDFQESIYWNKRVDLRVERGQTVVLSGTPGIGYVIRTAPGSEGARIGDSEGGNLIIDAADTPGLIAILRPGHTGAQPITFEQIQVRNPGPNTNIIQPFAAGHSIFRGIVSEGGRSAFISAFNGRYLLEDCRLTRTTRDTIFLSSRPTFTAHRSTFRAAGLDARALNVLGPANVEFHDCWLQAELASTSTPTVESRGGAAQLAFYRSAIIHATQWAIKCRTDFHTGSSLTLDHCDIYGPQRGLGIQSGSTNSTFRITNTNFGGGHGISYDPDSSDAFLPLEHCNYFGLETAWSKACPLGDGNLEIGIFPDYLGAMDGDLRYTNASLLTAGAGGSPIGSNQKFNHERIEPKSPLRLYVAPEARGDGSGSNPTNAARYYDPNDHSFWDRVRLELFDAPVTVVFLAGTYLSRIDPETGREARFILDGIGNPYHRLTLEGDSSMRIAGRSLSKAGPLVWLPPPTGVIFRRDPADQRLDDPRYRPNLFTLMHCRNILMRQFHFRGSEWLAYAHIIWRSSDITVEDCSWEDMPRIDYGATGVHRAPSSNITYRRCSFKRIGQDKLVHMMYHTDRVDRILIEDCYFEDGTGDFIRFRNQTDNCEVRNCTFVATGHYRKQDGQFISIPIFNDEDPGDEYFGTQFKFHDNTFSYPAEDILAKRYAMVIHHYGFNSPGRRFLLNAEEGALLEDIRPETVAARCSMLLDHCGIDTRGLSVYNNNYINVARKFAFGSWAMFGATSPWSGDVEIFDLVNQAPVSDRPLPGEVGRSRAAMVNYR